MYVGIHTASLPQVFAEAERRIILHAAVYSRFAESQAHREGIVAALAKPGFRKLQAITLPFTAAKGWKQEFWEILRPGAPRDVLEQECTTSRNFLIKLAGAQEGRVEIYETRAMPCMPVVIVDDRIFFGHYAHSDVLAPEGYWFGVHAPVEQLITYATIGGLPADAAPRLKASYRFVAECLHAMRNAKRMLL